MDQGNIIFICTVEKSFKELLSKHYYLNYHVRI